MEYMLISWAYVFAAINKKYGRNKMYFTMTYCDEFQKCNNKQVNSEHELIDTEILNVMEDMGHF